jgi:hypothetical protein
MSKLNLTFDQGAPIDAGKLMQLVEYLNEIDANTFKLSSDVGSLANQNAAVRMISGTHTVGKVSFSGSAIQQDITFAGNKTLTTDPSAILVTLETTTKDADMVHYIKSPTATGFSVMLNRVAGISGKTTTAATTVFENVKVHYLALAKLDA